MPKPVHNIQVVGLTFITILRALPYKELKIILSPFLQVIFLQLYQIEIKWGGL